MFVTFCPQVTTMTKKLIKATNLFHYKPPSGKNFDVCIFLCLVKLDFNSSETCVDGKRKVFFFSTYGKICIYIYICSKFTFSKESYQMMRCIFFICLRLFWALDVKLRRFYRIPWVIIDPSLVFSSDIIVHLFSIFKLIPCYNLDGWIWAKNSPNQQIIKTPLFIEECVLLWMLHCHNWKKCQVISFKNLRQHK